MSQESIEPPVVKVLAAADPADWTHAAEARLSLPTAEQMRTADGVFIQRKEPELAAGLMGLWSSAVLLHDLAVETFQVPAEDEEKRKKASEE